MSITYRKGDLFLQIMKDNHPKFIAHITNNIGMWGAGFTKDLSKHFDEPGNGYHNDFKKGIVCLGGNQYYQIIDSPQTVVANMCAQMGVRSYHNPRPIKYEYLGFCLSLLNRQIQEIEIIMASVHVSRTFQVHMPKIGSGLAGGDWNEIESIIEEKLGDRREIVVYEL